MAHECSRHRLQAFGFRCCYFELKERARLGEDLSAEERAFVGLYEAQKSAGGWHQPNEFISPYEFEPDWLSAEDSAMLHALMNVDPVDVNRERLEFLG